MQSTLLSAEGDGAVGEVVAEVAVEVAAEVTTEEEEDVVAEVVAMTEVTLLPLEYVVWWDICVTELIETTVTMVTLSIYHRFQPMAQR